MRTYSRRNVIEVILLINAQHYWSRCHDRDCSIQYGADAKHLLDRIWHRKIKVDVVTTYNIIIMSWVLGIRLLGHRIP